MSDNNEKLVFNMNKAILMGRLTRDPEIDRYDPGKLNFTVACNKRYKNKDGIWTDGVNYIRCFAIGKDIEAIMENFHTGRLIYIEGEIRTSDWKDEKTGKNMEKTRIFVDKWDFVTSRPKNDSRYEKKEDETSSHKENDSQSNFYQPIGNISSSSSYDILGEL